MGVFVSTDASYAISLGLIRVDSVDLVTRTRPRPNAYPHHCIDQIVTFCNANAQTRLRGVLPCLAKVLSGDSLKTPWDALRYDWTDTSNIWSNDAGQHCGGLHTAGA